MRIWVLWVAMVAIACGDGATAGDGDAAADADAAGQPGNPDATPAAPCDGLEAQPLDAVWTVTTGDGLRSFRVHVPASYEPSVPTPVVLNFHGITSNGLQQELFSRMLDKADAAGFIAVHPEGIGNSWNAGVGCCGTAQSMNVDDVGFTAAMLDELEARLCVDTRRVYATGMSNGGYMSHRLGCELADRIAAIAPVAGTNAVASCVPSRPVPVIHFHGTDDETVSYDYVAPTMSAWVARNGCNSESTQTFANGDSVCETWTGCDGGVEVVLCTVDGGGHTWPGGLVVPALGHTTMDLIANDAMWDFFQRFPL